MQNRLLWLALLAWLPGSGLAQTEEGSLGDKTLLAWVSLTTLEQRGGSALTIDNGNGAFDGIVFGELEPGRWMPGSNNYTRTEKNQARWPAETATAGQFVQLAIVYRGREISVYRNGKPYAKYTTAQDPQKFGPRPVVLFGRRHLDAHDKEHSIAGLIKDARIYAQPLDQATIAALKPGRISKDLKPWAWWSFADEGLRERTGRFNEMKFLGDVHIEKGCLVLPGKGATLIAAATRSSAEDPATWAPVPADWSFTGPVPPAVIRSTRLLRDRLLADPYRPTYHFCPPEDYGMPGDPNGAFYHNGRYHLMYLYNRTGAGFCWGHISSQDLVHLRHHPDAIGPGNGDEGCFSGGAFVDTEQAISG